MRRRLAPEARQLEIVEAAERLLAARGGQVRVEDVVAEAGAAKGTFFRYFPVWDDLLEAIRGRTFARWSERYAPPAASAEAAVWSSTLETLVQAFVDFTVSQRQLHAVLFHSDFASRRPLAPQAGAVGQMETLIRAGQTAGAFASCDPRLTASFLFAVMHEAADQAADGADRTHIIQSAAALLRRVLVPGDAP